MSVIQSDRAMLCEYTSIVRVCDNSLTQCKVREAEMVTPNVISYYYNCSGGKVMDEEKEEEEKKKEKTGRQPH